MADNEIEIVATLTDDIDTRGPKAKVAEFGADAKAKLTKAGQEAGDGLVRGIDGRLRDSRGRFAKAGNDSGDSFTKGLSGRIFGQITTTGAKMGASLATSFTGAAGPLLGVAVVAGLQAAVALAPALGGLMGFALVAGVAGAVSAQKPAVQAAFRGMVSEVGQTLEEISGPMDRVLINFARDLRDIPVDNIDQLGKMFARASTQAGQLTSTVRPLVTNLLPGISDALEGAQPTIDVLQDEIPELGTAISGFLSDLSEGGEQGAQAMQLLMDAVQNSLGILGETIKLGNKWMEIFPPGILLLTELGDKQGAAADAARQHAAGTEELAAAEELAAEKAKTEADALDDVIDKMHKLGRLTLTSRDAERAYQEAVDDATESARKNGRTLDINTDAGRKNQRALDAIVRTTMSKVSADLKAGGSMRSATAATERGRAAFIAAATAMGMETGKARALAASLFAIPNVVRTVTIRERFIADARARGGRVGGGEQMHAAGGIQGAASGGARSGLAWVGEQGPELMHLPPGTQVHSNPDSKRMAAMGGGGGAVIELVWAGSDSAIVRELVAGLRYRVRTEGRGSAERFFALESA